MTNSNRTLLVETLGRRIHFSTEVEGFTFEQTGVVVGWFCPVAEFIDELGYSLCIRDDKTGEDDFYDFHEIRLIGKPTPIK
ncbi:hypothetical protein ACIGCM_22855 [Pseudomonas sp. NPDC078700]|uniref:hypothetical protein n=1 Tax=Pseudomonas sp. NPDC078700 TaxID=3364424 RepID=UPI0037C577CA